MPKPLSTPRWADVGGTITVPSSGRKDTGWTPASVPTDGEWNWFNNLTYQWCTWLDAFESTAHTWSALQTFGSMSVGTFTATGVATFGGASVFNGAVTLNNTFDAMSASYFAANVNFNSTIFVTGTATFLGNAIFDTASFNDDVTFNDFVEMNSTLHVDSIATFDQGVTVPLNGGGVNFTGANNLATDSVVNKAVALNTPKVWAHITLNGTATPVITDGFNIASVSQAGSVVTVTIAGDMANANYAVIATVDAQGAAATKHTWIGTRTAGAFDVGISNADGTLPGIGATSGHRINLIVMGRQ